MGAMIECELFEREGVTGASESGERHGCLHEKRMAPMQGPIVSESRAGRCRCLVSVVAVCGRSPQGLGGDFGAEQILSGFFYILGQIVEVVCPPLHHPPTLWKILSLIVSSPDGVPFDVG